MADNRKLMAGILNLPESARKDLAQRAQDVEREGVVGMLRKAGKEMYENPIVNTAIGFAPVLGDVQAAGETMAALNRGAPWQETAGYAAGMLPFVPMIGKTVWHGSPHGFPAERLIQNAAGEQKYIVGGLDQLPEIPQGYEVVKDLPLGRFRMDKIGTGEGAQAYGHGAYLAEAPETAKSYSGKLSSELSYNGKPMNRESARNTKDSAAWALYLAEGDKEAAKASGLAKPELIDKLDYSKIQPGGQLYKVDLPDEQIAKMLDWDKPLSEQAPEVLEAIKKSQAKYGAVRNYAPIYSEKSAPYMRGGDFYRDLADSLSEGGIRRGSTALSGQDALASQHLNELGIPGIQYLDQASRGAGDGTRNYVVFSDEIPQILERNGTPLGNAVRNFEPKQTLESLNPTGTVFTGYDPTQRATMPLGKNLGTLDQTMGINPDEMVTIYRGVPSDVSQISPGDFITTNERLAKDYAGSGKVISQKVPARTVLDDLTEPLGEEYIYRP